MKQRHMSTPTESIVDSDQPITAPNLEDQIRGRAYQIYEERGRQDGFAEQDWLQAEAELTTASAFKAAA